jgi:hypothetical protein
VSSDRGVLTVAVSVAMCCGAGWLLVATGVIGASTGLWSSPELTVAAVGLAGWAMLRLVVTLRQTRVKETR